MLRTSRRPIIRAEALKREKACIHKGLAALLIKAQTILPSIHRKLVEVPLRVTRVITIPRNTRQYPRRAQESHRRLPCLRERPTQWILGTELIIKAPLRVRITSSQIFTRERSATNLWLRARSLARRPLSQMYNQAVVQPPLTLAMRLTKRSRAQILPATFKSSLTITT